MTTNRSARVPFVHQSFSPFRMKCDPSSDGVAVVDMFAGSEPASTSVSANALIAPFARRGKKRRFWSSVPNSVSGCGTPIDWCAEISAVRFPSCDVINLQGADVRHLRQAEPTVLARDLDAERADVAERLHHRLGNLTFAIDLDPSRSTP